MSNEKQQTPQANDAGLASVLTHVLSREGLEQNLDIGINLSPEGEVPLQIVLGNANVKQVASSQEDVLKAIEGAANLTLTKGKTAVKVGDLAPAVGIRISGVPQQLADTIQQVIAAWPKANTITANNYKMMEAAQEVYLAPGADIEGLMTHVSGNIAEGMSIQVEKVEHSFEAYLKKKYNDQVSQNAGNLGFGYNQQQMQQQQMMMMYMQQQYMMMNMMNFGANAYMPKNNMFVRRAKGSEGSSRPKQRRSRNPESTTPGRTAQPAGGRKQQAPPAPKEQKTRVRLDSDNFPSLGGEADTENVQMDILGSDDEEEVTQKQGGTLSSSEAIIAYFKANIDDIKRNPALDKFTDEQVPIIDRHGDVRLDQLNAPAKQFQVTTSDSRKGSFVKQRKPSFGAGSRKNSGRKRSGRKESGTLTRGSRKSSYQQAKQNGKKEKKE